MSSCASCVNARYSEAMTNTPDLIGTAEAAGILGKSPRTVHRMVESGVLTPVVIAPGGAAGAYLFARADVERVKAGAAA